MRGYNRLTIKEKNNITPLAYGYVYLIENTANHKRYVGQTSQSIPEYRWTQHKKDSHNTSPKSILGCAMKKYGQLNFTYTIIDYANSIEELNDKEQWYIKLHKTNVNEHGYNLREGGCRGMLAVETRIKMSYSRTGKKLPPRTPEHCRKISDALIGKKRKVAYTQEQRDNISKATTGKKKPPLTLSHREKISQALADKYIVCDPGGSVYEIHGLYQFCKKLGLNSSNMCQVALGTRKHHKKWTIKKAQDN